MSATLPTNWNPDHAPTAAELAQVLNAITRITNIAIMNAISPAGITGSTSATYVDVSGTSTSWTKTADSSGSDVMVLLQVSGFVSAQPTNLKYGIKIGSTDYDIILARYNVASSHQAWVGFRAITGVAAGAYTPIVRTLRVSGTGTIEVSADDTVSFLIGELPK